MDRRQFLRGLFGTVAVAAAPKFIFDMGANLYKKETGLWINTEKGTLSPILFPRRFRCGEDGNFLEVKPFQASGLEINPEYHSASYEEVIIHKFGANCSESIYTHIEQIKYRLPPVITLGMDQWGIPFTETVSV